MDPFATFGAIRSTTTTPPTMAPAESTAVRAKPIKAGKDPDYLMRQAARIMQGGGSQADVLKYWQDVEGVKLGKSVTVIPSAGMDGAAGRSAQGAAVLAGADASIPGGGAGLKIFQGLTFGLGDEAVGTMLGLLTGQGASKGIDIYRDALNQQQERAPIASTAAELTGAAAGGIGAGAALGLPAKAAQLGGVGKAALVAAEAGGGGAVAGAGNTQGGASERALGAVLGGALALGTVGLGYGAGKIAGSAVKPVVRGLTNWSTRLQTALPGSVSASATGRQLLAEALQRDGISVTDALAKVDKMAATGAPVTVADVGGENTLGLIQAAASMRGPAKQKLTEELISRQGEQGQRLLGSLFRSLKIGAENAYDAADQVIAKRSEASTPLYSQAYTKAAEVTPKLAQLLKNPRFKAAYEVGRGIANEEDTAGLSRTQGALPVPPLEAAPTPASTLLNASGAPARPASGPQMAASLPIRGIDYMKRGLDTIIEGAGKDGNPPLDRQHAVALRKMLNDALDEVGTQHPVYGQARSTWKGGSDALDAMQLGKGGRGLGGSGVVSPPFHTKPPEMVAKDLAKLDPAGQEMYRIGAMQDMADWVHALASEAPDVARTKFGGKVWSDIHNSMARRLQALVHDPDVAQQLLDHVWAEARISYTTGKLGGSRTAPLASEIAQLDGVAPKGGGGGILRQTAGAVMTAATSHAKTGWTSAVSDELSNLATKGLSSPAELRAMLLTLKGMASTHRPVLAIAAGGQIGGSSGLR